MLLADKFVPAPRTSPVEEKENFWVARNGEHEPLLRQEGSKCNGDPGSHRSCCILVISSLTMAAPTTFPILQPTSREAHPHENFSASRALEEKLRQVVRGEVRFD